MVAWNCIRRDGGRPAETKTTNPYRAAAQLKSTPRVASII